MKRFQNRVALSRFSLALASLFGALVWLAAGLISRNMWIPFLLMALSTYLMAEINNRNALIRVRTNMVSSAFLLLSLMGIGQNFGAEEAFVQLCFVGFLLAIFHTYQNKFAVAYIFYAFLLISISSLAFVQMLWFVPLLACLLSRPLYALSWKGISAVVLATVLPYWIVAPYLVYMGDIEPLIDHFDNLIDTKSIFDYSHITVGMLTEYVILVIFAGIGWIHFIRTSYKDKIRTRMFLNAFVAISLILMIVIPVAPLFAESLLPVLIVSVSPLVAHFITLTETRLSNITFIIMLILVISVTIIGVSTDWLQTPLGLDRIHIVIE